MATTPDHPPQGQAGNPLLVELTRRHRETSYVLFVVSGALALVAAWMVFKHGWGSISTIAWLASLAMIALGCAVYQMVREPEREPDALDNTRVLILILGGLAGLATSLLGLRLAWESVDLIMAGLESWRKRWVTLAMILAAIYGGLGVMFVALQLARADERSKPWLRRWLYGTNAVLSVFLLLAILGFVNVMASVSWGKLNKFNVFNKTYDWTTSRMHSLSPASKNLLEGLDKPVKVYVLLPGQAVVQSNEIRTLLNNCRSITDKIEVVELSPRFNQSEVMELDKKYQLPDFVGMLIVYDSGGQELSEFIKHNELFSSSESRGTGDDQRERFKFKGETAFMSKLAYLMEGKTKPTVYFTQGHGELELNSFDNAPNRGLGQLRNFLEQANYTVKELPAGTDRIPVDASVVVIARPAEPFPEGDLKALRDYMTGGEGKKKGKLVALMDVVTSPDGTMIQTGLENFLSEYNVRVENNRILNASRASSFGDIPVTPNPNSSNPIARTFVTQDGRLVLLRNSFNDVRTVEPKAEGGMAPHMGDRFHADTIWQTLEPSLRDPVFTITDLRASPAELVKDLQGPEKKDELERRLSRHKAPLSVAVAVTEPTFALPSDARHGQQEPRLIVFGDASWVTNAVISDERMLGAIRRELFRSCLAWLRERPDIGQRVEDKERTFYVLESEEAVSRLRFQPALLIVVGIAALGTGIWVVRRR